MKPLKKLSNEYIKFIKSISKIKGVRFWEANYGYQEKKGIIVIEWMTNEFLYSIKNRKGRKNKN